MSAMHLVHLIHTIQHSQDGKRVIKAAEQTAQAAADMLKKLLTGK